ncbi:hypothetical protein KVR01_012102 [Diaporthe batatas]|uniref:uncharacterized protein n=1 Tax=Diaporthe batatas TaxID=748121 RepID=UPI001D04E92F|nr:uncharacterized protein KVR01_012102 [Diaporthe batatas]KAG8158341.1 hypothetical protein KVR01_012102 [Diaporthe batatas]
MANTDKDNVVTKNCIVVASRTDNRAAMAGQKEDSNTGSVANNTAPGGQQQSTASKPPKTARGRAKPSSAASQKQPAKKTATATGRAAVNKKAQSTDAASAPAAAESPSLPNADGRAPISKRDHEQAFPPREPKREEYARRSAPREYRNQGISEIQSIHSSQEDEDSSDSDAPLVQGRKKRIVARAPNHPVGEQIPAQAAAQAAQIQNLTQQLDESRAACDEKEQRVANLLATVAQMQRNGEAYRQTTAVRTAQLQRENVLVQGRYTQLRRENERLQGRIADFERDNVLLQGRNTQQQHEYNQLVLNHNNLQARAEELRNKVTWRQGREERWQQLWDQEMARVDRARLDLAVLITELSQMPRIGNMHGGAGR